MAQTERLVSGMVGLMLFLGVLASPGAASGQQFDFSLDGSREVPPTGSSGFGFCQGFLDQTAARFDLTCTHDVAGAVAAHLHRAPTGVNGPIVFGLGDGTNPIIETWTGLSPGDISDLLTGQLYMNIHSGIYPDGEIRGQILNPVPTLPQWGLILLTLALMTLALWQLVGRRQQRLAT